MSMILSAGLQLFPGTPREIYEPRVGNGKRELFREVGVVFPVATMAPAVAVPARSESATSVLRWRLRPRVISSVSGLGTPARAAVMIFGSSAHPRPAGPRRILPLTRPGARRAGRGTVSWGRTAQVLPCRIIYICVGSLWSLMWLRTNSDRWIWS